MFFWNRGSVLGRVGWHNYCFWWRRILLLGFLGMQSPPCPGTGQLCPSQVEMGAGYGQWGWGSLLLPAPAPCPPGTPKSSRQPHSRVPQGGCAAPALCPAPGAPFSWLAPPSPPHWTVVGTPGSGQRPQPSPRLCSPCVREQQGCSPQHWRLGGLQAHPSWPAAGQEPLKHTGFPGMVLGGLRVGSVWERRPQQAQPGSHSFHQPSPWGVWAGGPQPVAHPSPPACNKYVSPWGL